MKKEKDYSKDIFSIGLICVVSLIIFYKFLFVFFTGDDFFHFKIAMTDGTSFGFLKLFGFHPFAERGVAFYRPIFREGLYHVFYSLFGLNSDPFRILQIAIHFLNITLVYLLFNQIFKNKKIALISSFIFAVSAAQVGTLYYLAGGIQAQGASLFLLLSCLNYKKYLDKYFKENKILAFVFLTASLASHEMGVVTFPILLGLYLIKLKNPKVRTIPANLLHEFWIPSLIVVVYIYVNLFVIGFSKAEVAYQPNFSIPTLMNTLLWYIVWAFGLPEMLVDFVRSGFSLNPNLLKFWGDYFRIIFPSFFLFSGLLLGQFIYLLKKDVKRILSKELVFLAAWFVLSLLPVIFLPLHKKTYYLEAGLPAFAGLVACVLVHSYEQMKKVNLPFAKIVMFVSIFLFIVLNTTSVKLSDKTYWAAKRGRLAEKLLGDFIYEYPKLPKGANVYIENDPDYPKISGDWGGTSTQANYILNGSDALELWYDDPTLNIYYEDLVKKGDLKDKVLFKFVASLE